MKIDKNNPFDWLYLILSTSLLLIAIVTRPVLKRRNARHTVVFYGHTLNGNLLALYEHWTGSSMPIDCYFLSFHRKSVTRGLKESGIKVIDALSLADLIKLTQASVVISSHGLHHFVLLRKLTDIKFVDVFHAPLAFKGFDSDDFAHLHGHDQVWVSSEHVKKVYVEKYGFAKSKIVVTGSARVESIQRYMLGGNSIKTRYGLDLNKTTVLIAPTWKQDSQNRSIVPFGLKLEEFLKSIINIEPDNIQIIFRAHLNSGDMHTIDGLDSVHILPYSNYSNTEEFLAVSDILINDWSSIAFDFITTGGAAIFLDVNPPFKKGFSAGPEYRYGAVVGDADSLGGALSEAVRDRDAYNSKYAHTIAMVKQNIFGNTLDRKTLSRCDEALVRLISE